MSKFINFEMADLAKVQTFGRNEENRVENHAHVARIKRQMLKSMDLIPPITVNVVTNHIIDGQHRKKAYTELVSDGLLPADTKLKVMYVSVPVTEEKEKIIDANINSKNWGIEDFISSYAKAGIESYVKLEDWCKKHTLTSDEGKAKFRYGAAIITGKGSSTSLKNGEFSFEDEDLEKAEAVHAEMVEIAELFNKFDKGNWVENLAISWSAVREQHDFRAWMREMKLKKGRMMKMPKQNQKDWDAIFAQIHMAIDKKAQAA